MNCRAFLKISLFFVVGALVCGGLRAEVSEHGRPNVVYMMLDEIGYFELSSMGHKVLKTPNLDRLAAEGMRFTQCLAGGPVCAPTRCVLLTGKHMGREGDILESDIRTIIDLFRNAKTFGSLLRIPGGLILEFYLLLD